MSDDASAAHPQALVAASLPYESDPLYRHMFESIDEGLCIIEVLFDDADRAVDYRFIEVNTAFERQSGIKDAIGRRMREIAPAHEEYWFEIYGRVARTGRFERFDHEAAQSGRYFSVYAFRIGEPEERKVAVLFSDVTERQRLEESLRVQADHADFRARLSDALRTLRDPDAIQSQVARLVGEQLGSSRAFYAEADPDGDHVVVRHDYHVGVPGSVGRYHLDDFGPVVAQAFREGRSLFVADTEDDPDLTPAQRENLAALQVRAHATVCLTRNGRLAALLGVRQAEPRHWTRDEIHLLVETADRTWAAIYRARTEIALHGSEERSRLALGAAGMGSFFWYPQEDRSEPDARMLALFGLTSDSDLTLEAALTTLLHPDDRERYGAAVARATDPAGSGELAEEIRVRHPDGSERWLAIFAQVTFTGDPPLAARMAGVGLDITGRRQAEEALRRNAAAAAFRAALSDALRPLGDPVSIQAEASRLLGEHLGVSRVFYGEIVANGEELVVEQDYVSGVASLAGRHRPGDFGVAVVESLQAGRCLIISDASQDPRFAVERDAFAAASTVAAIGVPLIKHSHWVAVFAVHQREPRDWTADEVALVQEVAERTWDAVERARSEVALRENEQRLQEALTVKDEFLGLVSHELRTPLTSILGLSRLLDRGDLPVETAGEVARDLRENAQRLHRLIENMLLLSRAERLDQDGPETEPLLLHHIVQRLVAQHLERHAGRRLTFEAHGETMADGHAGWIEQILENLLGNAEKYTEASGAISVIVDGDGQEVRVMVLDEGPGLSDEQIEQVFEAFYRSQDARQRADGAGLGLAVCRRLVELQSGRIWAARRPTGGAEFGFSLPACVVE